MYASDLHSEPQMDARMDNVTELIGVRLPVPVAPTQGTLALALLPRNEPPEPSGAVRRGAVVVPIDHRARKSIEQWARRFVQAAAEIVGGDRPATQLLRWTSPTVYHDLRRRARLVALAGGHVPSSGRIQPVRPRVASIHSCFVHNEAVEVSAHLRYGERSRAIAARFERIQQRWVCTALEFA